jgi:hypothetical protein
MGITSLHAVASIDGSIAATFPPVALEPGTGDASA